MLASKMVLSMENGKILWAKKAQAKLTVLTSFDKKSKFEYTFYSYTERRSLMAVGDSAEFYVSRSFVDKIISDAGRVMTGETITPTSKY